MACVHAPAKNKQQGFSLLELSVILIVISIIIGAVMSGANIYRQASLQRTYSDFVLGWRAAYISYVSVTRNVQPGDDPGNPKYAVNGAPGSELCGVDLINEMLAKSINLPEGRAPQMQDRYVYTDQAGAPHELSVCLMTVPWAVPGGSIGAYTTTSRHVMRLRGLTPEAATSMDAMTDGRVDARFGDLREVSQSASTSANSAPWSKDGVATMGDVAEGQAVELEAYMLVGR